MGGASRFGAWSAWSTRKVAVAGLGWVRRAEEVHDNRKMVVVVVMVVMVVVVVLLLLLHGANGGFGSSGDSRGCLLGHLRKSHRTANRPHFESHPGMSFSAMYSFNERICRVRCVVSSRVLVPVPSMMMIVVSVMVGVMLCVMLGVTLGVVLGVVWCVHWFCRVRW
jgi:hypothetical protein